MRSGYAILSLLLIAGGGSGGFAPLPVEPPAATAVAGQETDPEDSIEDEAEPSDPFAQFDLGVASLAQSGTVSEWIALETSGLALVPETVEVQLGQTIDALLIERGVRPDVYARSLVAEINPNLSEAFELSAGESVTLFQVRRPEAGPFASGPIALQPYQAEREAVHREIAGLAEAFGVGEAARTMIERLRLRVVRAARDAVLTDRLQLQQAASMLRSYNSQVTTAREALSPGSAWPMPGPSYGSQPQYAAVARLTDTTAAELRALPGHRWKATIRVRVRSTGAGPSGHCEVGWAPLGFAPHKPSRVFESYSDDVVIRVPASALHVWIARSRDAPSDRSLLSVQKTQLIDGRTVPMTIPTPGRCAP
jgi:hypothetical protein